jgi:hypothetical protein
MQKIPWINDFSDTNSVLQQMAEFADGNFVNRVHDPHEPSFSNNYNSNYSVLLFVSSLPKTR